MSNSIDSVSTPATRHYQAEEKTTPKNEKHKTRPKHVMTIALVVALICSGLLTANMLMMAWLRDRNEQEKAAYQRVIDNHPLYYQDLIEKYADENNLEPAYVAAIILNESSFRPEAESGIGARGLMQVMPETAEWIAHKIGEQHFSFGLMYDPEQNIRYGCWYLKYLSELFLGDPVLVTAAYHAGQGQVQNWLNDRSVSKDGRTFSIDDLADGPTKTYVRRVTRAYGIYQALYYTEDKEADPNYTAASDPSANKAG